MKDVQYEGDDHDDNFDALKRHMQQLSEDYARVVEERGNCGVDLVSLGCSMFCLHRSCHASNMIYLQYTCILI